MNTRSALLVGGDGALRETIEGVVRDKRGCRLTHAGDVREGVAQIRDGSVAVAIVHCREHADINRTGAFLYAAANQRRPVPTVVVLGVDDINLTLGFLQMGAVECLYHPISLNRLSLLIDVTTARDLVSGGRKADRHKSPSKNEPHHTTDDPFLVRSPVMCALMDDVRLVARLETTVLLTGETGVGKTMLARAIHRMSPHRANPFLTLSCAALSPTLIESELFGHVRGAFTGAERDTPGKFVQADNGTLLMDDVEAIAPEVQAKFLRVVEDRVFEPVGSRRSKELQARLIVATNKPLEDEIKEGRFRADLFYRLNVARFHIPALRDRKEEIGEFVETFADDVAKEHGLRQPHGFSGAARRALEAYSWPGNVRELHNVVESALIKSRGDTIDVDLLPKAVRESIPRDYKERSLPPNASTMSLADARDNGERARLIEALERNDGNRSRTAAELGISRAALYKKLRKHNLGKPSPLKPAPR